MPAARCNRPAVNFQVAGAEHQAEISRLLRENPMQGAVSLRFEREPDFRLAAAIEGEQTDTIVAVEDGGRVVGLGSRSTRDAWINGEPGRIGYLSQLRIDPGYRLSRRLLLKGYEYTRKQLHEGGDTLAYVTTIVADNKPARRLLGANLPGMPMYREWGGICTLAMPVQPRSLRPPAGVELRTARDDDLDGILSCLNRCNRDLQFAPRWSAADLLSSSRSRGLELTDFIVALRGSELVACVAIWDQSGFKQTIVDSYTAGLRRLRPVLNLCRPLTRAPYLPPAGSCLRHAYLSHFSCMEQNLAPALIACAMREAKARGHRTLTLGLAQANPLLTELREAFGSRAYESVIYLVHWEDGSAFADRLQQACPHLEVATI